MLHAWCNPLKSYLTYHLPDAPELRWPEEGSGGGERGGGTTATEATTKIVTLRNFPGNPLASRFVVDDGGSMTSEATNGHHVPPIASASAPTVVENTELNRDVVQWGILTNEHRTGIIITSLSILSVKT